MTTTTTESCQNHETAPVLADEETPLLANVQHDQGDFGAKKDLAPSSSNTSDCIDLVVSPTSKKGLAISALLFCLYLGASVTASLYNKWLYQAEGNGDTVFPFPVFASFLQQLLQVLLAAFALLVFPSLKIPKSPRAEINEQRGSSQIEFRWFAMTRILPFGAAAAADIGLGNMSLKFISLTLHTMCKSTTLAFVLGFAFIFGLQSLSWGLVTVVPAMTAGIVLLCAGSTSFNSLGFILVMISTAAAALRRSLAQILLIRYPATANPFCMLLWSGPMVSILLLLFTFFLEDLSIAVSAFHHLTKVHGTVLAIGIVLLPGLLAFILGTAEMFLLRRTNIITVSICAVFKEVIVVIGAVAAFHDVLNVVNIIGLILVFGSTILYNYFQWHKSWSWRWTWSWKSNQHTQNHCND